MKKNYMVIFALVGVITLSLLGTAFVINKNNNQTESKIDGRKVYTVTDREDGWSTLTVPYYGYQISFPSDLIVENNGKYIKDEDKSRSVTYHLGKADSASVSIDIKEKTANSLVDEIHKNTVATMQEYTESQIGGLNAISFVTKLDASPTEPVIKKTFLIDLGNGRYAYIDTLIGTESAPKQYEEIVDDIVSTFRKIN